MLLTFAACPLAGCASREERIQTIQKEANDALFENKGAEAVSILRRGLEKYADSNEIRIALSRALQNDGETEEAVQLLEAAVEQEPANDQLWVKIGELRAQLGQSEAAIRAFESYLKNHGNDFLAWKAVALEYEKLGMLTQAIKAAARWNELTPSSQPALKLGQLYLASRNVPQARSWFSQAAAYADQHAPKEALAELIRLETSLKQLQQASVWLQDYAQRYPEAQSDPRVVEAKNVIDNWIRAREEISRAAADLEAERRALEDERLVDERARAEAERKALDDELAANAIPPTQQTPPPSEPAEERPPETLFSEEESESVAAPSESPPTDLNRREQAIAAIESQDYDQAISLLWTLLGENADDPEIWHQLSRAYFAKENWFDAEATILEARRRAPRSEPIANQYLKTIAQTQSAAQALEESKALRRLFPRSPSIALTHAQTLRSSNASRSLVAAAYRDFLALANRSDPGFQEANRYLQSGN